MQRRCHGRQRLLLLELLLLELLLLELVLLVLALLVLALLVLVLLELALLVLLLQRLPLLLLLLLLRLLLRHAARADGPRIQSGHDGVDVHPVPLLEHLPGAGVLLQVQQQVLAELRREVGCGPRMRGGGREGVR